MEYSQNGKLFHNYEHNLYFPFGGTMVEILHDDIRNSEMASDFFSMYYTKVLGEHMVQEETLQKSIIEHYENKNTYDVMEEAGSTGFLVKPELEFMQ